MGCTNWKSHRGAMVKDIGFHVCLSRFASVCVILGKLFQLCARQASPGRNHRVGVKRQWNNLCRALGLVPGRAGAPGTAVCHYWFCCSCCGSKSLSSRFLPSSRRGYTSRRTFTCDGGKDRNVLETGITQTRLVREVFLEEAMAQLCLKGHSAMTRERTVGTPT